DSERPIPRRFLLRNYQLCVQKFPTSSHISRYHPESPHVRRGLNCLVLEPISDKHFNRSGERFSLRDEPVRPPSQFSVLANHIPSLLGRVTQPCLARKIKQTLLFFKSHWRLTAPRSS